MSLSLNSLNPNQKKAVTYGKGPLLVLAGAGSGKTSTMSYRIAHLVAEKKVSSHSILGLSFTNKAATELKERVKKLVTASSGAQAAQGITISTFHSLCARFLRTHAERLGFRTDFAIVDRSDQKDILKTIFKNLQVDDRKFDHEIILSEFGQAKSRFYDVPRAQEFFLDSGRLPSHYGIAAASAYEKYQSQLKLLNSMDFDDLQFYALELLENHDSVREAYNLRFQYILVDEYQDTNPAQFKMLSLLTQKQKNICVVGDDDQSIYSWRGADATHILEFPKHYPGAEVVVLDQNYRSTSLILEAANAVIRNNKVRHPKSLWSDRGEGEPISEVRVEDDHEEGDYVAQEILKLARENNRPWEDFVILYRSNTQSRVFEEALRRNKIPYRIVGGQSFLERKEVKNVLSYWRLIASRDDDPSLRRIFNWPARGIGKSSFETLAEDAFKNQICLFDAFEKASTLAPRAAAGCTLLREQVTQLTEQLDRVPIENPESLALWAKASLETFKVKAAIEEENEDPVQAHKKWENVEELVHSLGQWKVSREDALEEGFILSARGILRSFLNRMVLESKDQEEKDLDDSSNSQVTLLTLHGAKGLEYPVVFLVGMEDGFLPHKRTLEGGEDLSEERRLAYVGITRAKDLLILTRAKNRIRYGKPVPRYRSRFLDEIPKDLILTTDRALPDANSSVEARAAHEVRVKNHLDSIRALLQKN